MPRATNNPASRARRKRIMLAARGFFGARSKVYTVAKNTLEKGWQYAFRDRKFKKRVYRRLWIARINAATRAEGINYSRFIHALGEKGIALNRKALADLALNHPDTFKAIVASVKNK
ncbi:MAG: 50S ribosomal protein L20 [Saprospiraceae bacterium]|nr:50S ribosomal protein L20 [Saprospiraceae bacterium]MCC7506518.1 50S ribosomal protein L20 [Saprospiraceae bacterium]